MLRRSRQLCLKAMIAASGHAVFQSLATPGLLLFHEYASSFFFFF